MSRLSVKARMAPVNDVAAAQAAFEAAIAPAYVGEEIAVSVATLFPEGVDAVETSLGAVAAGVIRWTPLSETPLSWTVTATDTGHAHALSATVTPRTRILVAPEFSVALGPVEAGRSVGAPGSGADIEIAVVFATAGDPARAVADVEVTLLVDGVAAGLPHVARAGEVMIAQGRVEHPTGALTRQSAPVKVSTAPSAPVFVAAPTLAPALVQVGDVVRLSEGAASGYPAPSRAGVRTLGGADVTAAVSGLEWTATAPGRVVWTVTAANGAGPDARAEAVGTVAAPILEAASPNAVADVLPAAMTVGTALGPEVPGRHGPNLVTDANDGIYPPENVNRAYVAGDEGWVSFDITTAPSSNSVVLLQSAVSLPVGTVLLCENLSASPRAVRFIHRTGAVNATIADVAAGATAEHVVGAGFEDIRLTIYGTGTGFRVRVRVKDAVAAQPRRDIDLRQCFSGGAAPLSVTVSGLPAGIAAADGVITGDQIPAVGAGGDYLVRVRATDALGLFREVERTLRVSEAFSIQSVTIRNLADGSQKLAVGDTATMDVAWRGWPGPYPASSGLWPQWRRGWRDQTGSSLGSGPNLVVPAGATEVGASAFLQLDAAGAATATIAATPVAVAPANDVAPSLPSVTAQTSAIVSGRTVTIALGSAQGKPTPMGAITALAIDGVDSLSLLSGDAITVTGTAAAVVTWTVAWTNAAGAITSAGSANVAATGDTTPAAIAATDWRVVSAVTSGTEVFVAIDRIPAGATRLDVEIAGVVQALDAVSPGVFVIGGRPEGTAQAYRVRAVNVSGAGVWSDSKSATATRASNTRLACWADGEKAHALTAAPTDAGSTSAMTEGVNRPFRVAGGGEAEVIRSATSVFKTANAASPGVGDWIFYDPLGSAAALKPAETAERTIHTSLGATTIVVHGAAGMVAQPAVAAVGWDADGDPVVFHFDRVRDVGRFPDGRPFVIGPARLVHNGGDPVTVTPDPARGYKVVADRGAPLCVIARRGIIPPADAPATDLGLKHAYVRRAGAYDFAADGWSDSAAAAAPATGLTIRPTYETAGVYYAGSGSATCKVRFRKVGDAAFCPAHDLWCDDRDCSAYPAAFMAAKHRGVLHYLEPGATYEVQVKDGKTYRRTTFATWSRKVAKTTQVLGTVEGDVTISRAGDMLTVTRGALAPLSFNISGGRYAEIADGRVIGGTISLDDDVERVILRGVDTFGGARDGILLGAASKDVRILGGRTSGWGGRDSVTGLGAHQHNAIRAPDSPNGLERITVLGRQFGSPRYSASMWEEGGHPWGPGLLAWQSASGSGNGSGPVHGRIVYVANSATAWDLRVYYDGIGGTGSNKSGLGTSGGYGPDSHIGWNFTRGTADESAELEGSGACMVVEHNVLWCREVRPKTAIAAALGLSWIAHGPMLICRNLHVYEPDATRTQAEVEVNVYKIQAYRTTADPTWTQTKMGRKLIYHETSAATRLNFNKPLSNTSSLLLGCWLRNNVMRANSASHALSGTTNLKSATHLEDLTSIDADKTLDANWRPTGSALVGRGEWIANVNDGGPFYEPAPSIGALRAG